MAKSHGKSVIQAKNRHFTWQLNPFAHLLPDLLFERQFKMILTCLIMDDCAKAIFRGKYQNLIIPLYVCTQQRDKQAIEFSERGKYRASCKYWEYHFYVCTSPPTIILLSTSKLIFQLQKKAGMNKVNYFTSVNVSDTANITKTRPENRDVFAFFSIQNDQVTSDKITIHFKIQLDFKQACISQKCT